jgi:predicted Kef-type K+ transport protein
MNAAFFSLAVKLFTFQFHESTKRTATTMKISISELIGFLLVVGGLAVPIDIYPDSKSAFKNEKIPINVSVPPVLLVPVSELQLRTKSRQTNDLRHFPQCRGSAVQF